ncbi:DNA replication/repair protein RecF [Litorivicinus lipolyticus]|uniref:DNA replication and repair protein RecF n=1 Tax=Litorivicinus lipolyticus TaxID=418701 RepID=A0A5Q2Q5B2_9GAMM|nr:DNA replication/repair protein RecF [Litorivicinus lipolyticus]QGG79149.1 DNA replication/repair protein RecF [Litorivicinus lipolyticus]
MFLSSLHIERLRALDAVDLELSAALNVFVGPNGAGKTSVLEAVSFLATGRSFLGPRSHHLIQDACDDVIVAGRLCVGDEQLQLGVRRERGGGVDARINGEGQDALSAMARALPFLVVGAEGLGWVAGTPGRRRSLLDWGVFHVLGQPSLVYTRYRKALEQRNKALKNARLSDAEISLWDPVLDESGLQIHRHRLQYFDQLCVSFSRVLSQVDGVPPIELSYRAGFSEHKGSLADALGRGLSRDRVLGSTQSGPHRGDLSMSCRGVGLTDALSRGQQKVVVAALVLAQQELLKEHQGRRVVLLVDDLAAELDDDRQRSLFALMTQTGAQVLLTAVEPQRVGPLIKDASDVRMFHVKQGAIAQGE